MLLRVDVLAQVWLNLAWMVTTGYIRMQLWVSSAHFMYVVLYVARTPLRAPACASHCREMASPKVSSPKTGKSQSLHTSSASCPP